MKSNVSALVLSFLLSLSISAACPPAASSQYECKGRQLVTNAQELAAYLEDYSFNSKKSTIKGLTLSGSFSGDSLEVASPCAIKIKSGTTLNYTGRVCLISGVKVTGADNITLNAQSASLSAPGRVVLRNNLNATIAGELSLISTGSSIESRAHIRHTSNVTAGSLKVMALRRATLGHTSLYNVSGKITLSSNGEDLPDDAELGNSEWSSIWRDTVINAGELSITALERARIAKAVVITAPLVTISAKSCSINKSAVINSEGLLGECFSGRHPIAKFKYSPKKEAVVSQTILFDAAKSSFSEGSRFFWSFYEADDNIIELETAIPSISYAFSTLGRKKIELKIITPEGLYSQARRKINITGSAPLQAPVARLSATPITGEAPLEITLDASGSSDSDGVIVKYIFSDGTNFAESSENKLSFIQENPGTFNYEVEIVDNDGLKSKATAQVIVTPKQTDEESAILAFFKYNLIPSGENYKLELIYESRTLNGKQIVSANYTPDGEESFPVSRRVMGHKEVFDFNSPDPVQVTLEVTDELGGVESYTHVIDPNVNNHKPSIRIDTFEYAPNQVTFFSNLIFDDYGQLDGIERYSLDFGDGNTQEIDGPWFQLNHDYQSAGNFNASLTVFGNNGESFTHYQEIEVLGESVPYLFPVADFRVEQGEDFPGVRLYVDQSISPNAPIKTFLWNLGDGTTAYGSEVLHFYDAGAYDITLTAILEDGSTSDVKRELIIMRDAPNLIGAVNCYDEGDLKVSCDFSALDRFSDLSEVKIHFGDSEISEASTIVAQASGNYKEFFFNHSYQNAGDYTVSYQVLTNRGEELVGTTQVSATLGNGNQAPIASIQCFTSNLFVDCNAFSSFDRDGFIVSYEFSMGDGAVFSSDQVFYDYPSEGEYEITLTVTDNLGERSIVKEVVTVEVDPLNRPIAQISCSSSALTISCQGTNSYDPGSLNLEYEFYVNDILQSQESAFSYTAAEKGSYRITLLTRNSLGLTDTINEVVDVSNNKDDLIFASLNCYRQSLLRVLCSAGGTEGVDITFQWLINGEATSFETSTIAFETEQLENVEIELVVQNSTFTKRARASINQVNVDPVSNFSYSISDDGVVTFDATDSFVDGVGLDRLVWSIDGIENETTSMPIFNKPLREVVGKSVELKVIDEIEREALSQLFIINNTTIKPRFSIAHTQKKGKASKEKQVRKWTSLLLLKIVILRKRLRLLG